jgi:hypothetical protein
MPAISVDTFFACFLMVLLVLSAMAATSKILQPFVFNGRSENTSERWNALSKYILQNIGTPEDWGESRTAPPSTFGLARADGGMPYEVDIDKVCRLNSENVYAVTYAQAFTALGVPDASFRIEVKPVFEVNVSLAATFPSYNDTVYQFEVLTTRHGVTVETELACYTVAQSYLELHYVDASDGRVYVNITLPNTVTGPALLAVIAKSLPDPGIASFNVCPFAHNSSAPNPKGTFLRLSPLNYSLDASFIQRDVNLSDAYALTFNYHSTLVEATSNNESATFDIPHFLDSCPTVIVVTGHNSTALFAEWTTYPQIPLQAGADFSTATSLSNVFSYTYIVSINSAAYECTVWLGGPRE